MSRLIIRQGFKDIPHNLRFIVLFIAILSLLYSISVQKTISVYLYLLLNFLIMLVITIGILKCVFLTAGKAAHQSEVFIQYQ